MVKNKDRVNHTLSHKTINLLQEQKKKTGKSESYWIDFCIQRVLQDPLVLLKRDNKIMAKQINANQDRIKIIEEERAARNNQ